LPDMDKRRINTIEELYRLNLQNCYARHGVLDEARNKILVGKPVIASFLGISEKTLKRYFKEDHKLHDIPILRDQYRCLAFANDLFIWLITSELNKIENKLVEKAHYIAMADFLDVTFEHYMEHYIYQSKSLKEPNKSRLRTKKYYSKTIDKVVQMVKTRMTLTSGIQFRKRFVVTPP